MNVILPAKSMALLRRRHLKGTRSKIVMILRCMAIFLITLYISIVPVLPQEYEAPSPGAEEHGSTYMLTRENEPPAEDQPVGWGPTVVTSEDDGGILRWDVSGTAFRYLRIPVRINISGLDGKMEIKLPYVLNNVGRTVSGKQYTPTCEVDGITNNGWEAAVHEDTNEVVVTNTGAVAHGTLDIYYEFDCWNMPSDAPFTISCTVKKQDEQANTYELKGKIHTGHGVEIAEYENAYGNSDYAFDGFGGVDKKTAYVQHWDTVYETYFGLKKEDFDNNYMYDIAAFLIKPTGQQPYDINVCFTPDQNGELVGAAYMMDSRNRPDALCKKIQNINPVENKYSFTINNDSLMIPDDNGGNRLAVVSGNLSDPTDNKAYTLYFLVKYPKTSLNEDANHKIQMNASLSLTHTGIDSKTEIETSKSTCLYDGPKDPIDRIYWASYVSNRAESRVGLTYLKKGFPSTLNFSADFFCLNENRSGFNAADGNKYRLETIIDLSFLTDSKTRLEAGDYKLTAYKLNLIDAAGNWSQNSHGVPNVGWTENKFTAPDWATNEYIYVYGSSSLTENSWTELGQIPASEVWAANQDRVLTGEYIPINSNIVRLKLVYNSRLTTVLRVGYQMELQPKVLEKVENYSTLESLGLTNWFNYVAYKSDGTADLGFYREPVSDPTMGLAREYDDNYPCSGYENLGPWDEKYSLRNCAKAELGSSTDAAGMVVAQTLYASNRSVVGNPYSIAPNDSYSWQKDVINASEIVYSISGIVTNGVSSLADLKEYQNKAPATSPYKSKTQRYYVLLPEGLELNKDPDDGQVWEDGSPRYHYWAEGSSNFLSPYPTFYNGDSPKRVDNGQIDVPVSGVSVPSLNPTNANSNISEMYWLADGSAVLKDTVNIGQRQLLIFERTIAGTDSEARFDIWGWPSATWFWGRGLSFSAVPTGGIGSLPAGSYEAEFWCQFLDENGSPISMDDFVTNVDKGSLDILNEATGNHIDSNTLLYIPIDFNNSSGSNTINATIRVKNDSMVDYGTEATVNPEDTYSYELTYSAKSGSSENVVLWCDIEKYARNPHWSEWKGSVIGVDLKNNSDATVYVLTEDNFNVNDYIASANAEWLTDSVHGWQKVDNPDTYQDWGSVKSIAFSFEGRQFSTNESAAVRIKMKAPADSDLNKVPGQSTYMTYNEFVVSDDHNVQGGEKEPGRALVGPTVIRYPSVYELPSVGGVGAIIFYIAGSVLIAGAAVLLVTRKRVRNEP